jgi:dolichol-phosphate mannosyltransferase
LPTYQEAENIEPFLNRLRETVPAFDVLVVDDSSPDGTGELADKAAAADAGISVLHRSSKDGLGAAYRSGLAVGLERDYDVLVQMDSDFSHDPSALPQLVAAIADGADCSIGSRYVAGGSTPNWPMHRRLLSRYGNRYAAALLQLGIHDTTSGFRAYRSDTLRRIDYDTTRANGYAFQTELAYRTVQAGLRIVEIPITFLDRAYGTSKMSGRIISESMALVTYWGVRSRLRQVAAGRR